MTGPPTWRQLCEAAPSPAADAAVLYYLAEDKDVARQVCAPGCERAWYTTQALEEIVVACQVCAPPNMLSSQFGGCGGLGEVLGCSSVSG